MPKAVESLEEWVHALAAFDTAAPESVEATEDLGMAGGDARGSTGGLC